MPAPPGLRVLDAYTAGRLTRAYMAAVLGELVVIDACAVVTALTARRQREGIIALERIAAVQAAACDGQDPEAGQ